MNATENIFFQSLKMAGMTACFCRVNSVLTNSSLKNVSSFEGDKLSSFFSLDSRIEFLLFVAPK